MSIDAMRENYDSPPFLEADAHADPIEQFRVWFEEVWRGGQQREPNAMTLATCTKDGAPSARIVLLKGYDQNGFVFYTNYESAKAKELEGNPVAALVFYWESLSRTVRISGNVSKVSREQTEAYFKTRPRGSQLGAWASPQSEVIDGREALQRRFDEVNEQYTDRDVPAPPHWGGYRVTPTTLEFWQGQTSRLHDRLRYTRKADSDTWTRQRLAP